jgi:N-acetyl-anhydromuramyl-L-alanine amidase AmpD
MVRRVRTAVTLIATCALGLAACGSGGGSEPRASTGKEVDLPQGSGAAARGKAAGGTPTDERHQIPRPRIVWKPIPYGSKRKSEMAAYARRHYDIDTFRLIDPRVIVEHFTANDSFSATYNTFAPDRADPELHELPGVCAHFVIDKDGTIYQLVKLGIMCRHTVGLNYTSIGIEHVGQSDEEILNNGRQLSASLKLTRWLRCTKGIFVKDVIGHNENRSSPYHRENVDRLKNQTHGDWTREHMKVYRKKLRSLGGC